MKILLIFIIKVYWIIVPEKLRGVCLFSESCSKHVFRKLNDEGLNSGIKSFIYRFNNCRHPYLLRKIPQTEEYKLHLKSGQILNNDEINSYFKK